MLLHGKAVEWERLEFKAGWNPLVLSYPGPDRSVRLDELRAGRALPRRYRNRRIGEFLKELDMTEGRATGIPKILHAMQANGSPPDRRFIDRMRCEYDRRTQFVTDQAPDGTWHVRETRTPYRTENGP